MLPNRLSEPGPLLTYLQWLRVHDPKLEERAHLAVRAALRTPDGSMLLDLLEKSTVHAHQDILSDVRALEARNAQCFIALDLRRILSDEREQVLEQQTASSAGRRNRVGRSA